MKPSRGAVEVKPTGSDAWVTADSEQVSKYWKEYGQVLVTNYRDFLLIGRDSSGQPVRLGSYRTARDEKACWRLASTARKTATDQGERIAEFLKLVILSPAILTDPKDVAWVLAYYAREAKSRIEAGKKLAAMATIRESLAQALGLKFEGEKGEHFFRSSLVQTLFYGVFSAWVLWCKEPGRSSNDKFDWKLAQWSLHVPHDQRFVRAGRHSGPARCSWSHRSSGLDSRCPEPSREGRNFLGVFRNNGLCSISMNPSWKLSTPNLGRISAYGTRH